MALVEAEIAQYVTPGPGVFWDVSRARYEQTPAEGGMGLLPLTDLIGAAHCGLVQRLLSGEAGLWAPFAERWFRAATGVWGLGLELLMAPEFPVAEVVLPPYWLDMLQSWRGLQLTAPARRVERVSQEASDRCVFYSPLVLEGGASLRGAVWRPLAAAGVNTVGAVAAAVFGGTQLAPGLDALARRVWNALPEEWRRSGARRAHPFMTLRREMAEVTWVQQRGAGQARVLKALEATARERRFRLWDRKHPVGSRRSVALVDYTGPRCWRRVLGPGFSWSRAFRLATDRRLDRAVGHTVYRVLHGLYLRPFPERQLCPHCQQEADTAHALHCQTHARALGWLKAVADRLAGSPVTLTPDVLLGGVLAHSAFVGELGWAWEVLRMTFLSALYGGWVKRHCAGSSAGARPLPAFHYSHVVVGTLRRVRRHMLQDWRRLCERPNYVQRDGRVSLGTAPEVLRRRFDRAWVAAGWARAPAVSGGRLELLLSLRFPIRVHDDGG